MTLTPNEYYALYDALLEWNKLQAKRHGFIRGYNLDREYFRGYDDYTMGFEPRETLDAYMAGYEAAEKASKKLAWNYLNYP